MRKVYEGQTDRTAAESMSSVLAVSLTAVFAALTFAATFIIRIPIPATGGYVHPGDALVILCGLFLGKRNGFLAAGIGSALSDLIGGYGIYIPVTFVIKGLTALAAAFLFEAFCKLLKNRAGKKAGSNNTSGNRSVYAFEWFAAALSGISAVVIVPSLYFLFEAVLYGIPAAAVSALPNTGQALFGLIVATLLYPVLSRALKRR